MRKFLWIAALLLCSVALRAAAPEQPVLVTRLLENVRPHAFRLEDDQADRKQDPNRPGENLITRLPDLPNGGKRYDVMRELEASGISHRPGNIAIYMKNEQALVLTLSAKDQDLAERLVEIIGVPHDEEKPRKELTAAQEMKRKQLLIRAAFQGLPSSRASSPKVSSGKKR